MIEYKDFNEGFSEKMQTKGSPICGQIELTFCCNLKCIHCYVAEYPDQKELSFSEIIGILDQIHKENCLKLVFTGGEPLLRKDFLDIYTYAKTKGFLISLFTNGTLLTEEIADHLNEYPPFNIEITLNGITRQTYEKITRISGSFQKCLQGIHLLLERQLPLTVKSNGMKLNRDEILKIKDYAESLGAKYRYDSILIPCTDGSKKPCRMRLSADEIVQIELTDDTMKQEWIRWCESDPYFQNQDDLFRCKSGQFNIDPYGGLQLCFAFRKPSFDLRQGSFRDGFYNFLPKIRSVKYQTESKCKNCQIRHLCSQCPARAQLENGDLEEPVEYFCELAHKRETAMRLLDA